MSSDESSDKPMEGPPKMFTPIGPGNHDRAWNDPPMFSTEFNITGRPAPNKLNKRVAYPLSAASTTGSSPQVLGPHPGTMPPMPGMPPVTTPVVSQVPPLSAQGYPTVNAPPPVDAFIHRPN